MQIRCWQNHSCNNVALSLLYSFQTISKGPKWYKAVWYTSTGEKQSWAHFRPLTLLRSRFFAPPASKGLEFVLVLSIANFICVVANSIIKSISSSKCSIWYIITSISHISDFYMYEGFYNDLPSLTWNITVIAVRVVFQVNDLWPIVNDILRHVIFMILSFRQKICRNDNIRLAGIWLWDH